MPHRSRYAGLLRSLVLVSLMLAGWLWSQPAAAYPWMIRHQYTDCATCHADPSGGELLTAYGRALGNYLLATPYGKDEESQFDSFETTPDSAAEPTPASDGSETPDAAGSDAEPTDAEPTDAARPDDEPTDAEPSSAKESSATEMAAAETDAAGEEESVGTPVLWGLLETPHWLLLGASYRHASTFKPGEGDSFRTFPMQLDLYGQLQFGVVRLGGSVGAARVRPGSPHARRAQVTTDQGDGLNLISRTHWVGAQFGDMGQFYVRAGRLNLPFGVRIPEHTSWIREYTRTDRESDQQHGVAFAYNGDGIRAEVMGIAGNYQVNPDRFRERGYSLYVERVVADWAAVGVSSLLTYAESDIQSLREVSTTREAHGVFARLVPVTPVVVLAEFDVLLKTDSKAGYVGFLQADYEMIQGLHLLLTGEVLDQGRSTVASSSGVSPAAVKGAGKPRLGGWVSVDWFFFPQLEFRLDAIARQQDPFTLLAQLHVYL